MRVVCISDTHCRHWELRLPPGELLVHAGDACGFGNEKEFRDFADWFRIQKFKYKVFVPGNHDRFVQGNLKAADEILGRDVNLLQDQLVKIEDFDIYGSPWQPPFCDWAFNLPEDRLKLAFDLIPSNLDLLVTHGPPKGICDHTVSDGHVGSSSLRTRLTELSAMDEGPRFHVFGHIHAGYGIRHGIGKEISANVAQCDEQYKVTNVPIVLNL